MKYWYIGAGVLVLGAAVVLLLRRKRQASSPDLDGGVRNRVDTNAPKVITSTRIAAFHCAFSTTDLCPEDSPIADCVMTLHADADGAWLRSWGRWDTCGNVDVVTDEDFFRQLQQIVSRYDFARHNGQYYTVSGLPPNLGMKLKIRYTSGERISAFNNQSCFLPLEAMEALAALFQQHMKKQGGI